MKLIFKKRDKIYLFKRNINTKRPSNKLDYKKLEFFKINKVVELVNYYFELLKTMNIYSIFYILLLKPILSGILKVSYIKIELVNPNTEYKVEEILN
jgi:hypothetical protein